MKKTTDYIGNFVYEDEGTLELRYFLTQEGRIMANSDGTFEYQYFLKDHLGNTRVTFNQVGEIIQEDSYYPFGMAMKGLNYQNGLDYKNKYLYNGKELQDEFGLRWYDNGARFYDAEIARWHVVDPLAEERNWSSTFCYTQNNPINRIDPNGMLDTKYEDEEGKMLLETNDGSDAVVTVTNDKREGFEAAVKGTEDTDNVVWNKVMKKYFLGFELSSDQETLLTHLSSDWTRKKAIIYWQNENIGNWTKLIISEVLSQNANPLNHMPTPINVKAKVKTPVKIKSQINIQSHIKAKTSNPWILFNNEMGKGKFTKKKYGSSAEAGKARRKAYEEWKSKNGF